MERRGRLIWSWLCALALLAGGARAAVLSVVPEAALAPLGVPALILGAPGAMPPVLSRTLSLQSTVVSALPPAQIAPHLIALAASPVVAERAAAKIIARNYASVDPAIQAIAASAERDPAFAAWFDGGEAKKPALALDGLTLKRGAWRSGDKPLDRLGQGEFGFVDAHPAVEGAVIKTVEHSAGIAMMSTDTPEKTAAGEQATAELLAGIDAGPRFLGRAVVSKRLVSVRERVYGDTVEDMMRAKRFGPAERDLIHELLRRLAAAGVMTNDLRPSNIMIGRTLLDPSRRAYIVDGGSRVPLPEGLDAEARFARILNEPVVLRGRFDQNVGFVEFSKPWWIMIEEGLERWSRVTRWQKFKGFWKDFGKAMVP